MEINDRLLEKLAQLSALKIDPQEKSELKLYLTKTLSYFEKIRSVDTTNVQPLFSPLNPSLVLRKDKPENLANSQKLLDQAPKKQGALVRAPLVLE